MSLTKKCILTDTVKLGADIAANLFVDFDGTLPAANTRPWGVTVASGKDDERVGVDVLGITVATAGAEVATAGLALQVTAEGKVIPQTGTNPIVGRARTTAAAGDDLIEILLTP